MVPNTPTTHTPTQVSWRPKLLTIHADRWEYLHSDMHAAAYALDPEFMTTAGKLDGPTQEGLMNVLSKLSLSAMPFSFLSAEDEDAAMLNLTLQSPEVYQRVAQAHRELAVYQRNLAQIIISFQLHPYFSTLIPMRDPFISREISLGNKGPRARVNSRVARVFLLRQKRANIY